MSLSIVLGILGPPEIILIVLAMVLLFGGKKIPELMKGIGQGIKEFKKASKNEEPKEEEKKEPEKLQNPQV
ncbi:MAG: twin-arginine translocase TatA/TatE family subunit [Bacteroidetes bacterium]|nr:twin-arginine translocase TatA/TatE family subunit [Bacteroidota bacterium]